MSADSDGADDGLEAQLLPAPRYSDNPVVPQKLCTSTKRHKYQVTHSNRDRRDRYLKDLFHTLLNLPTGRFLLIFLGSYLALYSLFALLYMQSVSKHCVSNITTFTHALWFSVHTSATIGYGHQTPNPNCILVNIAVMAEVLMTALLQATMVGLVFARFSVASSRAATIAFSSCMVSRGDSISFRVANLRNHQVLRPLVTLFMVHKTRDDDDGEDRDEGDEGDDDGDHQEYEYKSLELKLTTSSLWLGLPTVVSHKIDETSPLKKFWFFGDAVATSAALADAEVEFVALLDGVEEATSKDVQARHSWVGEDIRFEHVFKKMATRRGDDGALVVDWRRFHESSGRHHVGV